MANFERSHRKTIKHCDHLGHVHELTFSCYARLPLLKNETRRKMLAESVNRATARHHFGLVAFVFMPEHLHLIVKPQVGSSTVSDLLRAIKRPFSYQVKQLLVGAKSPLLKRLVIRQRPGVTVFRFWQEGPGYDRNLVTARAALASIDYLHFNPVRRGLVERAVDWKWSSARYYSDPATNDPELPRLTKLSAEWLDSAGS
jgi:putative transposase